MLEIRKHRYFEAYGLTLVYLGLGNHEEAFNWLEQSYRDRDGFNVGVIRVDQFFQPLYGNPRFEALAEKDCAGTRVRQSRRSFAMNPRSCFDELKRRNVVRAATFFRCERMASGGGGNRSPFFPCSLAG